MEKDPENFDKYLEQFVDVQMLIHSQKSTLLTKLKDNIDKVSEETRKKLSMKSKQYWMNKKALEAA